MAASDYVPTFFKKPLALGGASTDGGATHNHGKLDTRITAE
jgi:hypothetical protein